MSAKFHPSETVLFAYAAGSLDEPTSLLVASHLGYCPHCQAIVSDVEIVGGSILDDLPPATLSDGALVQLLRRIESPPAIDRPPPTVWHRDSRLPTALRAYLPDGGLTAVRWQKLGRRLEKSLLVESRGVRAHLLRATGGTKLPRHSHDGTEMTLVLTGGLSDGDRHYGVGDVATADSETDHAPRIDRDGSCVCLVVTDAPLRFSGLVGRVIGSFVAF